MFKKIASKLFGTGPGRGRKTTGASADGFFLNVRCNTCGETFRLFINTSYDLFQNFGPEGGVTYLLNKEIIGASCANRIRVIMAFDGRKNVVSKKIERGEFLDQ